MALLSTEKDLKKCADLTWMCLVFSSWVISTLSDYLNEVFAIRSYFLLMSVAIVIIAYRHRNDGFFQFAFFEIAIYNVVDEVLNMGDINQWYELPVLALIPIHSWYKFKRGDGD